MPTFEEMIAAEDARREAAMAGTLARKAALKEEMRAAAAAAAAEVNANPARFDDKSAKAMGVDRESAFEEMVAAEDARRGADAPPTPQPAALTVPDPAPTPEPEEAEPSPAEKGRFERLFEGTMDTVRTLNRGLIPGSDELTAAARATREYLTEDGPSWRERYDRTIADERARVAGYRERNPTLAPMLETAGAVVPAVATMGAGMGPGLAKLGRSFGPHTTQALGRRSFPRRVAGGAGVGGAYGGAYGFGEGEEDFWTRMESAGGLAALGAGIGGVTPVAGAVARPIISSISKRRAAKKAGFSPRAVDPVQSALEQGARAAEGPVKTPLPGSLGGDLYAPTRGLLSESLEKQGRFGYATLKTLDDRAEQAGVRISKTLDDELGLPEGVNSVVKRMDDAVAPQRDAAYKAAYAEPIDYASERGIALEEKLKRVPPQAVGEAKKLMDLDGDVSKQFFARIRDDGKVVVTRMPDVRELDYMTRALNDMAKVERGKVSVVDKTTTVGGKLERLSGHIRSDMRDLVPAYKEALDVAAPPLIARSSIELGSKAYGVGMSRDKFAAEVSRLKRMHPTHAGLIDENIARGMRNQIEEVVERAKDPMAPTPTQSGNVGRGAQRDPTTVRTLKDLSSKVNRGKVEMVLGKEKADRLFAELDIGNEAILTRDAMAENVRRANREALAEEQGLVSAIEDIGDAKLLTATKKVAGKFMSDARSGKRPDKTSAAVVNALMEPADPVALTRIKNLRHRSERGLRGAKRAEMLAGGTGLAATVPHSEEKAKKAMEGGASFLMSLAGAGA